MTWGWPDKGKKAHWFPDASGRAKCGKANLLEAVDDPPAAERCAACKKAEAASAATEARAAVESAPTPVRELRVRVPPGGDACTSALHAGQQVRASWWDEDGRAWCDWCAYLVRHLLLADGPTCVRCHTALCVPQHTPCCSSPHPHGRPLCCHCYGVTHHVVGAPCH